VAISDILDLTGMLVVGTAGRPHSYLSEDQTEVLTDYELGEPVSFTTLREILLAYSR
jgi:hypothetical protein